MDLGVFEWYYIQMENDFQRLDPSKISKPIGLKSFSQRSGNVWAPRMT